MIFLYGCICIYICIWVCLCFVPKQCDFCTLKTYHWQINAHELTSFTMFVNGLWHSSMHIILNERLYRINVMCNICFHGSVHSRNICWELQVLYKTALQLLLGKRKKTVIICYTFCLSALYCIWMYVCVCVCRFERLCLIFSTLPYVSLDF